MATARSKSARGEDRASPALTPEARLELYRRMLLVRRTESRLGQLFADGEIPGFIHLSIGQEATAVGVTAALEDGDTLSSTHRGHGHAIAKGVDLDGFFLELMGKQGGLCGGRGGSMHVAEMKVGMLGANGIVGAGTPIALGSALAHKVNGSRNVAVVFFGDGALAEGVLAESLNIARLKSLPCLFVCENNGWSEFSPAAEQFAAKVTALGEAYSIESLSVDGNDIEAVHAAAQRLVTGMRADRAPRILECRTKRVRGHFEGDPQKYRDREEIEKVGEDDPLSRAEARLRALGVSADRIAAVGAEIDSRIEAAVAKGRAAPQPDFASARSGVYRRPLAG